METAIKVENLSKKYRIGERLPYKTIREEIIKFFKREKKKNQQFIWALKNLSFEIKRGEVVGIIGPNGAGKTTLLKILSRITEPTDGYAEVYGRVGSLLEVGIGFHPELTGRENIYLNGAILGMKKKEIDKKFDEIVSFAELEKFLDTPVKYYSSGMYVRLAFSVAAHFEPDILLVDEVLAVGDISFQKKCLGKMETLTKEARTVLFVSHNMGAIESLCTKCIWLDKGKIVKISEDISKLIKEYVSSFFRNETSFQKKLKNEFFEVLSFNLIEKKDKPTIPVYLKNEDIGIEIELNVFEKNPRLSIGYALYENKSNVCLWWSFHVDVEPYILPCGNIILKTFIPSGLLNDGEYRIEMLAGIDGVGWILPPGNNQMVLKFIVKGGKIGSSMLSATKRPTLLFPALKWNFFKK
ncbi:MAG: ABC transporter ATP-binding protein [Candidatus Omnitrophica bacterium]|nr:ABC transporter ATP-binding protein [Candidatus Omnitrophota bacterium]